jgi:hypothetical protein
VSLLTNTALFTGRSERERFENEQIMSKLSGTIRIVHYQEGGRKHPLVLAKGCPVDFLTFNHLVLGFVCDAIPFVVETSENRLNELWLRVGYKPKPYSADPTESSPWSFYDNTGILTHVQTLVYSSLSENWRKDDILPALREICQQFETE